MELAPGSITVRFSTPNEALEMLLALAIAVSQNRPAFEQRVAISEPARSGVPGLIQSRRKGAAERLPDQLDCPPMERTELPARASFFLRLAAALLREKDFPSLPQDLGILIVRDPSRRTERPLTDQTGRLGAETLRTLQNLATIRADLFCNICSSAAISRRQRTRAGAQMPAESSAAHGYPTSPPHHNCTRHRTAGRPDRSDEDAAVQAKQSMAVLTPMPGRLSRRPTSRLAAT